MRLLLLERLAIGQAPITAQHHDSIHAQSELTETE